MSEKTHEELLKEYELKNAIKRLKISEQEIIEFEEKEANKARVTRIRVEAMRQEDAERQRRQNACAHKTGGKGKEGFLQGDGSHGYTVAHHTLPTGEHYMLCTRCQKEWHHPLWMVKLEVFNTKKTEMTKAQYAKLEAEYATVFAYGHEYTVDGEASLFRIPLLDRIDVSKIMSARP